MVVIQKVQKLLGEVENEMNEAEKRAKSRAKQQGLMSIISNKWVWCVVELVLVLVLYSYFDSKQSDAYQTYQDVHGVGVTYRQAQSAEWQAVERAENNKILVILAGIAIIGGTVYLAVRDSKKK